MMVGKGMLNRVRKGDFRCWVCGEIFWRESCLKEGGMVRKMGAYLQNSNEI